MLTLTTSAPNPSSVSICSLVILSLSPIVYVGGVCSHNKTTPT